MQEVLEEDDDPYGDAEDEIGPEDEGYLLRTPCKD